MTLEDSLNYIIFTNPVSKVIIKSPEYLSSAVQNSFGKIFSVPKQTSEPTFIKMDPDPLWKLASTSQTFVRIAGLSGAAAIIIGAYGAHTIMPDTGKDQNLKNVFDIANKYHLIHSVALLGVPLCRYPLLSGSFFILGISMFCGTCYYSAITGDKRLRRITPIGGTCFILGWLAMML